MRKMRQIIGYMEVRKAVLGLLVTMLATTWASAQEAQWRGPFRNGCYPDSMLPKEWPEGGPEVLFVADGVERVLIPSA